MGSSAKICCLLCAIRGKFLLRQAIDELPRIYSEVLILRSLEELSDAETALCVGITTTMVKVRAHRGKAMLRDELDMPSCIQNDRLV
jgi:DNA-directed RNA polymerase specialized sigma24 family protein